jgi:hypothetical protein
MQLHNFALEFFPRGKIYTTHFFPQGKISAYEESLEYLPYIVMVHVVCLSFLVIA